MRTGSVPCELGRSWYIVNTVLTMYVSSSDDKISVSVPLIEQTLIALHRFLIPRMGREAKKIKDPICEKGSFLVYLRLRI